MMEPVGAATGRKMANETIYCITCGKPNQAQARFCMQCGKPLVRPVSNPEATLPAGLSNLECPYCGNPMQVPADVIRLICIQCAASLSVEWKDNQAVLAILKI
jgi:DNA-directed RNA polymerase subunit RPC12/RpoP